MILRTSLWFAALLAAGLSISGAAAQDDDPYRGPIFVAPDGAYQDDGFQPDDPAAAPRPSIPRASGYYPPPGSYESGPLRPDNPAAAPGPGPYGSYPPGAVCQGPYCQAGPNQPVPISPNWARPGPYVDPGLQQPGNGHPPVWQPQHPPQHYPGSPYPGQTGPHGSWTPAYPHPYPAHPAPQDGWRPHAPGGTVWGTPVYDDHLTQGGCHRPRCHARPRCHSRDGCHSPRCGGHRCGPSHHREVYRPRWPKHDYWRYHNSYWRQVPQCPYGNCR